MKYTGPVKVFYDGARDRTRAQFLVDQGRVLLATIDATEAPNPKSGGRAIFRQYPGVGSVKATWTPNVKICHVSVLAPEPEPPSKIEVPSPPEVEELEPFRPLCPYGLTWQAHDGTPDGFNPILGARRIANNPMGRVSSWGLVGAPKWRGSFVHGWWDDNNWPMPDDFRFDPWQTMAYRRGQACLSRAAGAFGSENKVDIVGGQYNGVGCVQGRSIDPPDPIPLERVAGLYGSDQVRFQDTSNVEWPESFWVMDTDVLDAEGNKVSSTKIAVVHDLPQLLVYGAQENNVVGVNLAFYAYKSSFKVPSEYPEGEEPETLGTKYLFTVVADLDVYNKRIIDVSRSGKKFIVGVSRRNLSGAYYAVDTNTVDAYVEFTLEPSITDGALTVDSSNRLLPEDGVTSGYTRPRDEDHVEQVNAMVARGADPMLLGCPYLGEGPSLHRTGASALISETESPGKITAYLDLSRNSGVSIDTGIGGGYGFNIRSVWYDDNEEVQYAIYSYYDVYKTVQTINTTASGAFTIGWGETYEDRLELFGQGSAGEDYGSVELYREQSASYTREGKGKATLKVGDKIYNLVDKDLPRTEFSAGSSWSRSENKLTKKGLVREIAYTRRTDSWIDSTWSDAAPFVAPAPTVNWKYSEYVPVHPADPGTITSNGTEYGERVVSMTVFASERGITFSYGSLGGARGNYYNDDVLAIKSSGFQVNGWLEGAEGPTSQGQAGVTPLDGYEIDYDLMYAGDSKVGVWATRYRPPGAILTYEETISGGLYRDNGLDGASDVTLQVGPLFTDKGFVPVTHDMGHHPEDLKYPLKWYPVACAVHPLAPVYAVCFPATVSFAGMWPRNAPTKGDMEAAAPYLTAAVDGETKNEKYERELMALYAEVGEVVYPIVDGAPVEDPIILIDWVTNSAVKAAEGGNGSGG